MRMDEGLGEAWIPRVGEGATAKMVQAQRARFIQICFAALIVVWALIPLMSSKMTWMSLPVVCRAGFVVFALLVIFFGIYRQGQRRGRYQREAAVCALDHLRATSYPRLTRLPYVTVRSPEAFDRFVGSVLSD